jgi:hypothetical protein
VQLDESQPEGLRSDLGKLVRELLEESYQEASPISTAIQEHLGVDVGELPVHEEELASFELANLQLGIDAALARPGYGVKVLGLAGQGRRFSDVSLSDLLTTSQFGLGPPEYGAQLRVIAPSQRGPVTRR